MKPDLRQRRVVEVNAHLTWEPALEYRIYSCPAAWESTWGATGLILETGQHGPRVPLEINSVVTLPAGNAGPPGSLQESLRVRLEAYQTAVGGVPTILDQPGPYRFHFLNGEPWPEWLQSLTTSERCPDAEWNEILSICTDPYHYFEWPRTGRLLWPGCTRQNDHPYEYPPGLKAELNALGLKPDVRPGNGPAITAFLAAGGKRPIWGNEGWPIHHIYDGAGAVPGGPQDISHAVHDGQLFTHSAGLVAAHPVAHDLAHRSNMLRWLLRREAFLRFGFDPRGAFAPQ